MDMKFMNIAGQQVPATTQNNQSKPLTPFEKKARETAVSFEAIFLSQILKSMSMGLKSDGPFSGGHSEEIFQDVLSEEMGKHIARNGGIGLSDAVYKEILKTQEVGYSNVK
ncbi:MAG: rod-binding protein [Emcibacter sp.]|nr:rod-binding protein [Emcibacter sp.]